MKLYPGWEQDYERRGSGYYRVGVASKSQRGLVLCEHCEGCGEPYLAGRRNLADGKGKFCTLSCMASAVQVGREGVTANRWRGTEAGYGQKHKRIHNRRGKATQCVWGCESQWYEWANLTGHYDDIEDFAQMCVPCHRHFDMAIRAMSREGTWKPRVGERRK